MSEKWTICAELSEVSFFLRGEEKITIFSAPRKFEA